MCVIVKLWLGFEHETGFKVTLANGVLYSLYGVLNPISCGRPKKLLFQSSQALTILGVVHTYPYG